jgi:hypothetical protein
MRKFLSLFLVLFTLTFTFTLTCSAETLSDEILAQGKAEADLFLTLKQALGLDWIDEYNAYLGDPVTNPAPAWDTSVASLVSQGYLSSSFPTDFTIALTGQEVTISRTVSQAALREAMAIYLPAMTVSGDVVSLLVQRPAQWIAYETALDGKVDKDGSDNPDILPNSSLDFGSNSQINFVSNDGKILGVNSLFYKTQELDNRFVNITGDTMTGILTATGFKVGTNNVWHQGNDGTGSGLDADLLDGQHGAFYQNASNLTAGTVPTGRLSGTYNIGISGNAATASKLATARTIALAGNASGSASFDGSGNVTINTTVSQAANADKLDGYHHDAFVKRAGDTATGPIYFQGGLSAEAQTRDIITTRTPSGFWQTNSATTGEGWPQTTNSWYHLLSSTHSNTRNYYSMQFAGNFYNSSDIYYRSTNGSGTTPWNKMWHSGNDGLNSGLDADLLDGQDSSFYRNASNLNTGVVPAARLSGTYGISITGNAATATTASNSDKLDGYHHDAFVKRAGDTMTGALTAPEYRINDANTKLLEGANNSVRVQTNYGYTEIGPQNAGWAHFITDRPNFYFDKPVNAVDQLKVYNTGTYLTGTEGRINNNIIWHKGNQGSGSGLDADMVDGKHASELGGGWDVILEDRKSSGVGGGTPVTGSWQVRVLNTIVYNNGVLISLSNNQFTLPAGTYCIDWDAPAHRSKRHKTRLYNSTNGTVVAYGTSESSSNNDGYSNTTNRSFGTTVVTVTGNTAFRIEHRFEKSWSGNGLGHDTGFGTEVYTRVRIKKY